MESSGPGSELLQSEEGDCLDEDGPISSPSERACGPPAKEHEDIEASDDDNDEQETNLSQTTTDDANATSNTIRLNPVPLRDITNPNR